MPAFLIVHSTITDPARFQQYVSASEDSLAQFGGRYLLGGTAVEVLEGHHDKARTVIFQFPSEEHVRNWYSSPEYKKVKSMRDNTGEFDFVVVDSF